MPQHLVEEVSLGILREFLSRKGLKATLATLDQECPRTEVSLTNRVALARAAGLEKLMRRNKERSESYRTILEVLVNYLMSKMSADQSAKSHDLSINTDSPSSQTYAMTSSHTPTQHHNRGTSGLQTDGNPITYPIKTRSDLKSSSSNTQHTDYETTSDITWSSSSALRKYVKETPLLKDDDTESAAATKRSQLSADVIKTESKQLSSRQTVRAGGGPRGMISSKVSRGVMQSGNRTTGIKFKPRNLVEFDKNLVTVDSDSQLTERTSQPLKCEATILSDGLSRLSSVDKPCSKAVSLFGDSPKLEDVGSKKVGGHSSDNTKVTPTNLLMCEDLEGSDIGEIGGWSSISSASNQTRVFPRGRPITIETASALRQLLFGSSRGPSFNTEWRQQNLVFSDVPGLEYGLVQHKGGPCGVLAAVQAFVLKHLLFADPSKALSSSPCPSPEQRREGLVQALGDILWKAGSETRAVVALSSVMGPALRQTTPTYKPDGLTEHLVEHSFTDRSTIETFLRAKLPLLQDESSSGCIQFLLSLLLTKGVESIRSEMDEVNGHLIGAHGYCTQELVNLLLTGVASSNVFDGEMDLGSKEQEKVVLRGLRQRSEVGLLSLFEHYQSCEVGSHYKDPLYPIWVVCSESHFSVLFSHQRELLGNKQRITFDLHYYDGLAHQEEPICLTIDNKTGSEQLLTDDSLTPPLELCIRTRWKDAAVSWNNSEPIL